MFLPALRILQVCNSHQEFGARKGRNELAVCRALGETRSPCASLANASYGRMRLAVKWFAS
jgi:hypothetical protein